MGIGYINFPPFPFFVSVYVYASGWDFVSIALLSPFVLGFSLSVFFVVVVVFLLKKIFLLNKCFLNIFSLFSIFKN